MTEFSHIGRYEIRSELGRGGMATVYRAFDPRFRREVAIKVLPREFLHDPTFRARFEREGQAIAALEHPAILPVYDVGEEGGQPYMVMRLMTGGSLADRIKDGPLSVAETTRVIAHLAPALDEAHQRGIIHRDLKPANILFDKRNTPYLSDFGIVRLAEATAHLTGSGGIVGTPAYMAPELSSEGGVSPLVDIYALAVTIFQMLTGQLPYRADTPVGLMFKHVSEPVPDLRAYKPDLPESLQVVIGRGMAKSPAARYQTAGEMAADLQVAATTGLQPQPVAYQPLSSEAPTMDVVDAGKLLTPRPVARKPAGRVQPIWIGGAVLAVAVLVVGGLALSDSFRPEATPTLEATAIRVQPTATNSPEPSTATPAPTLTPTGTPTATPVPVVITGANVTRLTLAQSWDVSSVGALTWSPDGSRLAIVSPGGPVTVVNLLTGEKVTTSVGVYNAAAWSLDGAELFAVTAQAGLLAVLNPLTGEQIRTVTGDWQQGGWFSADGSLLLAWADRANQILVVVDTTTGEVRHTIRLSRYYIDYVINGLAFSRDGSRLALDVSDNYGMTDRRVFALDVASGTVLRTLILGTRSSSMGYSMTAMQFSPNGALVAVGMEDSQTFILWNVDTGQRIETPAGQYYGLTSLQFNPDWTLLASTSSDARVIVWDVANVQPLQALQEHTVGVFDVAWSPDGTIIASISNDGILILWRVAQ